jgi:hypothetical protein
MTLPSNASQQEFPNNVQTNYTTIIRNPIVLNGKYEVALHDITYSSQFSVDLGSIKIPNPFYVDSDPFSRLEFIEYKLKTMNGVSSAQFFLNLNNKISQVVMYYEYRHRYELGFAPPDNSIKQIHKSQRTGQIVIPVVHSNCCYKVRYQDDTRLELVSKGLKQKLLDAGGAISSGFITFDSIQELEKLGQVILLNVPEDVNDLPHNYVNFYKTHSLDKDFNKIHKELKEEYNVFYRKHIVPNFVFFSSDALNVVYSNTKPTIFTGIFALLCDKNLKTDTFEIESTNTFKFDHVINVINQACLYCDLIEDQYFGDVLAPILQVINLKSSENHDTVTFYENPMYVNVKKSVINSINIKILDLSGNPIKFEDIFSFVILKLHFRKKE